MEAACNRYSEQGARNAAKWHLRAKRNVQREVGLSAIDGIAEGGTARRIENAGAAVDDDPGLAEELERRVSSLADSLLQQVALKKLEGLTNKEIADDLDYTERTIERKLRIIRTKWGLPAPQVD